jgi:hypothetical protein
LSCPLVDVVFGRSFRWSEIRSHCLNFEVNRIHSFLSLFLYSSPSQCREREKDRFVSLLVVVGLFTCNRSSWFSILELPSLSNVEREKDRFVFLLLVVVVVVVVYLPSFIVTF